MGDVAGGYGEGEHGTLAERVARRPSTPSPRPAVGASPARHCLVEGLPGLLVEWIRTDRGWEGRVVTVEWLDGPAGRGWAVVERCLPSAVITSLV
ncbi:hypothetical protein GCM10028771_16240 [Nocardioides marmoraquaticus]